MAGNAVIGALRVVLGLDSAALDKGLRDSASSLAKFASSMKTVGLVAAGAMAGVIGGTAAAVNSALNQADELGKLAQSVGVPVEELSKLKHAADLSDVSLESLGTSLVRLSKSMSSVAAGGVGPAAEAFRALGISVKNSDGSMKSSSVVLSEVADKFAGYQDGANKTAIAVALFGRAGAAMIPMLNGGSAALEEAKREAEELGLVIDKNTSAAAENFNDNLTRLGKVVDGAAITIASKLAPSLSQISTEMLTVAKDSQLLTSVAAGLEIGMKALTTGVLGAVYAYKQFTTYFKAVLDAAMKVAAGDFGGAFETLKAGLSEASATAVETAGAIKRVWEAPDTTGVIGALNQYIAKSQEAYAIGAAFAEGQKKDAPAIGGGSTAADALQSYLIGVAKRQAALTAEMETIGMSKAAQESLRITLEAETIAKEKNVSITEAMRAKITETAGAYGALSQRVSEAQQRWNFVEGAISSTASALTSVIMGAKSASEAFKNLALSVIADLTQMIIKALLFKAIASAIGGPFGGMGSIGGFASAFGGLFSDGGHLGAGKWGVAGENGPEIIMGPANVVPMQVGSGSGSGGGGLREIAVSGLDPRKLYSGENMRYLIESINDAMGDGYRINLKSA